MSTITITTSKTYEAEDYYMQHVAGDYAQSSIDEICDCLDKFLVFVGSNQSRYSEWYYACQCRGFDAEMPTIDEDYCPNLDEYKWGICYEYDFMEAWRKHEKRISILHDALRKITRETDKHDYRSIWPVRLYYCKELLEKEVYDALEDVCHTAGKLCNAECDYYWSTEAYNEWIAANQDILDED